jgi:hypothetical protein
MNFTNEEGKDKITKMSYLSGFLLHGLIKRACMPGLKLQRILGSNPMMAA